MGRSIGLWGPVKHISRRNFQPPSFTIRSKEHEYKSSKMASIRILSLFSAALVLCLGVTIAEFADTEDDIDTAQSFRDWMKRGCLSSGSSCSGDNCCPGSFCNGLTGTCKTCAAKGKGCGYFKPCCPGSHCLYKGRISICT